MGKTIILKAESLVLRAELNDSDSARAFAEALPLALTMSRWGDEYYGGCGLSLPPAADAREVMEIGELAYWPPGNAFCIFFGPTPASRGGEPRAASAVNPLGRVLDDCSSLRALGATLEVRLEADT
jgi:hypothetical protein